MRLCLFIMIVIGFGTLVACQHDKCTAKQCPMCPTQKDTSADTSAAETSAYGQTYDEHYSDHYDNAQHEITYDNAHHHLSQIDRQLNSGSSPGN